MMKKILIIVVVFMTVIACASSVEFDELRNRLSSVQIEESGEKYSSGLEAYLLLIDAGAPGYKVLCESWLHDNIPESNWLSWSYDLATRYPSYQKRQSEYYSYFSDRLERDENFSLAAVNKLMSDKSYGDGFLLAWLRGEKGYRSIAYRVLKNKYSLIPEFDISASDNIRREQIKSVEKYINNQ